ncbi:MAG TPA: phosphoglucomutase (alpha-D-glucose-1,6-bisphosphate-dependent) [Bryobacteraceae bacterium]
MDKSRVPGQPPSLSDLINPAQLVTAYYAELPDSAVPSQRVSFGTSGHRGSALNRTFNEAHILAITQAICAYRKKKGVDGPLFLGIDTHALSEPAAATALEVLAANDVTVMTAVANEHSYFGYTPTPAISHAILKYNRGRTAGFGDGIVITPSHNPPEDGGFKYNPPHGGPAESSATKAIQDQANEILDHGLQGVKRIPFDRARQTARPHDFREEYVADLSEVLDLDIIRSSGIKIGVDPLGGAGVRYWGAIAERYKLNLTVLEEVVDPTFRFMTLDWDGRIRMDPSSPYAMRRVIASKDKFDVTIACDTDHDRHGVVTRSAGLLSPNQYLAVCVDYLCQVRKGWNPSAGIGKTVVSSSLIDRVTAKAGRALYEVPVGFKWFVDGLFTGSLVFGGEESAGASFVTHDQKPWSTDKDGIAAALLAAEMTARNGRDPGELYEDVCREHGRPWNERIDAPANAEQRVKLGQLSAKDIRASQLAGEPIEQILTTSPAGNQPIGGIKVIAKSGWFAARPSGTEDVYKIYAESFRDRDHLTQIQEQAKAMIADVFNKSSAV